ncbi:MAG: membrane protein insertase YidC [Candidatus Cloacimonadaceae bacterium]|nr:membrane protein insertase YidC [Candidatus Cloacimonadaceae bacterium]
MDKRTIYALMMMMVLFMVFDQFVWKKQVPQAAEETIEQSTQSVPEEKASEEPILSEESVVSSDFVPVEIAHDLSLENDLVKISFTNLGAKITQVELKNFAMRDGNNVRLIPEDNHIAAIKLIHPGLETHLDKQGFAYIQESGRQIKFYLSTQKDSVVVLSYRLNDDYGLDLDMKVIDYLPINGVSISFASGIADTESNLKTKMQDYKFILFADNAIKKLDLKKLATEHVGSTESFNWAAIKSKYFTLAIKETEPTLTRSYVAHKNTVTDSPAFSIESTQRVAKNEWVQSYTLYLGPADASILKTYGHGMDNIAELGAKWLRWLSAIFAWFLKFLHGYIRNYGVVIILFALVIKVVLHPLTHKQLDASLKMQKIQPLQQEIQQKYKGDPKRMQVELSKLYKEAGTSPTAGCLPLILQMPIFFSLYNVLRFSLDMRNAHFVGWLTDLSEPDKFKVLPILMGLFMILQSRMMQAPQQNLDSMDDKAKAAAQSAKMMTWAAPVIMFFVFQNMPAGLVLYWTTFNVFSIIQQYYLQKHFKKKDI